jgi:hypothetical protein
MFVSRKSCFPHKHVSRTTNKKGQSSTLESEVHARMDRPEKMISRAPNEIKSNPIRPSCSAQLPQHSSCRCSHADAGAPVNYTEYWWHDGDANGRPKVRKGGGEPCVRDYVYWTASQTSCDLCRCAFRPKICPTRAQIGWPMITD